MIQKGMKYKFSFRRESFFCIFFLILLGLAAAGNAFERAPQGSVFINAERWEEAEKIFRSDPRWLGGDGATSVDLKHGRVLWLFGDSFIDRTRSGIRRTSDLVRNTIAIQTGYDPSRAGMKFFWKTRNGKPAAVFARKGDHWFWPGSGIMVGRRLLIFLMEIKQASNALGFEACGWKGVMVENPRNRPDQWVLTYLISPQKNSLVVGSGNPVMGNGFLQVFATDGKDRAVYLVRWPLKDVLAGTLTGPQWWTGDATSSTPGWAGPQAACAKPQIVFTEGQMEFTVEYLPALKRYLQVQTLSVMNPCLTIAMAPALTGPWSTAACFFDPPEKGSPELLLYAGKSHPMLRGADMAFSYVVNTLKEDRLLKDMSIYFPIMLKGRMIGDDMLE